MARCKLQLITLSDVKHFCELVSQIEGDVVLESGDKGFRIDAKSIMGAIALAEWNDIWVCSDNESIYTILRDFIC